MNDGLVRLGREDVGGADSQCIHWGRALLKGGFDCMSWVQFVEI